MHILTSYSNSEIYSDSPGTYSMTKTNYMITPEDAVGKFLFSLTTEEIWRYISHDIILQLNASCLVRAGGRNLSELYKEGLLSNVSPRHTDSQTLSR